MTEAVSEVLEQFPEIIAADAGYPNGEQLTELQEQGHTTTVPANRVRNVDMDKFKKSDFEYLPDTNEFRCPASEMLIYTTKNTKNKMHLYNRKGCNKYSLQNQCTKADRRWVSMHFHEAALNTATHNVTPDRMTRRMKTVEPPFGTLKRMINKGRFSCWGLDAATSEYSLGIISYNLTKMINAVEVKQLLEEWD